ncbi:hypothetical protein [Bartonella sp. AP58NXGY]
MAMFVGDGWLMMSFWHGWWWARLLPLCWRCDERKTCVVGFGGGG